MSNKQKVIVSVLVVLGLAIIVYRDLLMDLVLKNTRSSNSESINSLVNSGDEEKRNEGASRILGEASKAAIVTSEIQINNCVPNPKTAQIRFGEQINFVNSGSEITLNVGKLKDVILQSNSSTLIRSTDILTRPSGVGFRSLISYTCNGSSDMAGYIVVTN